MSAQACPDDECICEKADTRDLSACMSCFLAVDPSESSVVQDYINTFETTCSGLGIPVSSISVRPPCARNHPDARTDGDIAVH